MRRLLAYCTIGCLAVGMSGTTILASEAESDDIWYGDCENLQTYENSEATNLYDYLNFGKDSFDMETYVGTELAQNLINNFENYYSYTDPMDEAVVAYWEELGIVKETHDADVPENTWVSYIPAEALEEGNTEEYPVVFLFHGHGNSVWVTETYGFAQYGAEARYITIIPEASDGDNAAEEFDRIMAELDEMDVPVDESRVYACGFSKGGYAVQNLAASRPDQIAAITAGGNAAHTENGKDMSVSADDLAALTDMPLLVYAGNYDQNAFPLSEESALETPEEKVAGYNLWIGITGAEAEETTVEESTAVSEESEDAAERNIGLKFTATETRELDGTSYDFGYFENADGVATYEWVCIEGQMHWPAPSMPMICWEFLSQFSRDVESGELVY